MRVNPTALVAIGVACGIGYLVNGASGAVWGGVIWGSVCVIATGIFAGRR